MITSMTGFARGEAQGPHGSLAIEIRSVNHRFLEPGFRLPDELRAIEPELRAGLAKQLRRGKVDCSVHLRSTETAARALQVDEAAVARLMTAARDLAGRGPVAATIDPLEVLRWPGVLRDDGTDRETLQVTARALFATTLSELVAARAREGARLRELVVQRCAALRGHVAQVRTRVPEIHARVRERLHARVAELSTEVDPARLEQEIVLLLQRLDVSEELDRLSGHLDEIERIVAATGGEAAGRRLDFLMQELNREANTLSSKSQDLEMTRAAVDMKVVIEQMREQVQNIE
jgi:uncharacterized protein (TIGR00255 family)